MNTRIRKRAPGAYVHERDVVTRMVYMAHPVAGDVEINIRRAKRWLRYIEAGNPWVLFVSQWILGVEMWDDSDPVQRETGLKRCLAQVERCDELWLVGPRVSDGMRREARHAIEFRVKVVDFTGEGREHPLDGADYEGREFNDETE